jgi:5'-nucleotidase
MDTTNSMITHVSFDLDGTLELEKFDKIVWNEEIPKLYAEKHNLSIEQAKQYIYAEYYKAGFVEMIPQWTNINYWFDRFGLHDWGKLMDDMTHHILLYDDALEALEYASKKYKLIMISSAEQNFLDLKLRITGIEQYFDKVISTASNYNLWRKDATAFKRVLEELGLQPSQVIHIGNDVNADVEAPSSIGIQAILIDRNDSSADRKSLKSLNELKNII